MTDEAPMFSLVYLTWNAEEVILNTLSSAFDQDYEKFEVVVVDNNSQDATISTIDDRFGEESKLRIVENDENLGFSRGINQGIAATRGDYICCYNHDTFLGDGYLSTLERFVTEEVVWTTARINYRVSDSQKCIRLLGRTRFTIPYVVDGLSGTIPVNFVPGDGLIISRKVYREVLNEQVFDPALPPRGEDVALSLQLRSCGIPLLAVVDAYSIHPDKGDRYAPNIGNLLEFIKTFRARLLAIWMYDSSLRTFFLVVLSFIIQPLYIHLGPFPKPKKELLQFINQKELDSEGN